MKGTRPLDNVEIRRVSTCFTGTYEVRNRGLFMLGVSTGGRISELLSLQIADVYQNEKPVTDLLFDKSIVKGGEVSRAVPVNVDGRKAIDKLVEWHREQYQNTEVDRPLFPSRQKSGTLPMHRQTAVEGMALDGESYRTRLLSESFSVSRRGTQSHSRRNTFPRTRIEGVRSVKTSRE